MEAKTNSTHIEHRTSRRDRFAIGPRKQGSLQPELKHTLNSQVEMQVEIIEEGDRITEQQRSSRANKKGRESSRPSYL